MPLISKPKLYSNEHLLQKRVRVTCPDCGSGGATTYPSWCHVCKDAVLMLPSGHDGPTKNWHEVINNATNK